MEKSLQTFTIQEASQRINVTKHTLRFWEKELEGLLVPLRTDGGQRRYTAEHLFIIEEIKRLKEKGLRLIEIKKRLKMRFNIETKNSDHQEVDLLADRIAEIVKSAVYSFLEKESL